MIFPMGGHECYLLYQTSVGNVGCFKPQLNPLCMRSKYIPMNIDKWNCLLLVKGRRKCLPLDYKGRRKCPPLLKVGATLTFFVEDKFFPLHKFQYHRKDKKESHKTITTFYIVYNSRYIYSIELGNIFIVFANGNFFVRCTCLFKAFIWPAIQVGKSLLYICLETKRKWELIEYSTCFPVSERR